MPSATASTAWTQVGSDATEYKKVHRSRPTLRPLDPQMRVNVAQANAAFFATLCKEARALPQVLRPPSPTSSTSSASSSSSEATVRRAPSHARTSVPPAKPAGHTLHLERPYSLAGLSPLTNQVARSHLPEELLVFDRANTTGRNSQRARPQRALRYVRAYPRLPKATLERPDGRMRRGCLFLDPENHLATGRRSEVYRAPLVASLGSSSSTSQAGPQRVSVVAKLARGDCRSHHLLRQEGRAYARMPEALQGAADAALPQFYGLYVPVDARGRRMCGEHPDCDGYLNADCAVEWPSPILLMEDCGVPIEVAGMDQAQRAECWSLVTRLHDVNVAHGSARASNVLVQPASPSAPPRYRLISLGRAEVLSARNGPPTRLAINSFEKTRERDMQTGLMELRPLQWADGGVTCSGEQ